MTSKVLGLTTIFLLYAATQLFGQASDNRDQVHIFPQIADGTNGLRYVRATLSVVNPSAVVATCTFTQRGINVPFTGVNGTVYAGQLFTYNFGTSVGSNTNFVLGSSLWETMRTPGTQPLQSGYGVLLCSQPVVAQMRYTIYATNDTKLSEATVFSSPRAGALEFIVDQRAGSWFAMALANDSDSNVTYQIMVFDSRNQFVTQALLPISARSQIARYLDELMPLPSNYVGTIFINGGLNTAVSGIGLLFTGDVFTTIPAILRNDLNRTF